MKFQPKMRRVLVSFIILLFLLNMLAPTIPIAGAALPASESDSVWWYVYRFFD
jgi:hypothetical protein